MKEDKIIAFTGIYGSLIMASNFENKILAGLMVLQAIIWLWRYAYLVFEKPKQVLITIATITMVIITTTILKELLNQ